uniref:Uncharacterized protein n=1 Tax=Pyrodinium bahamense TaxID=73915 RepID=A0A7S0FAA5_9DINO|mmetsp:Transcript_16277/g.44834  ORF Transcript_16277/g.44834 Transcript_16277/m.44834 type:complete len:206 (+) Transcript_16277:71-688(+)
MAFEDSTRDLELDDQIRAAQLEAGIKHPHSTYSRPKEPASEELNSRIRAAQRAAGARGLDPVRWPAPWARPGVGSAGPGVAQSMAPESFLGKWMDSYGNTVCVYSTDAFETRPMATLSKAPRPDIHLKIVPREDGWHCGDAKLDIMRSAPTQVCWVFPDGRVSTWTPWYEEGEGQEYSMPLCALQKYQFQVIPQMFVPIGVVCIS